VTPRLAAPPPGLTAHAPDAHWTLDAETRCSLWWTRTPVLDGQKVGVIGHYAGSDARAARTLLDHACRELAARGCGLAVGPMDGNTWRAYRLVTERGSEPPFFLEPWHPADWPGHFEAAGFEPRARYHSTVNENLEQLDPREEEIGERLAAAGVRIRTLDPRQLEDELGRIYAVTIASFGQSFLFTALDEGEFRTAFTPLRPRIRPDLVLLAEQGARPVGYVFALPDALQDPCDTVVVKTLARVPGGAWNGLGRLLLARIHQAARVAGYRRAIHALMHDANASTVLKSRTARLLRRYALFAKRIAP
jgi:GNAT superfamily N-acetyltransferase